MVSTTGSLSVQIKEHVWQGGKNFHLIRFNPILTSHPASLIAGKLRQRKPFLSVLHSLLFLLCACFTPPLCALCQPSELCVHFDPSVTTSQAFWPLLFFNIYMEPVPHLLPNHEAVVWSFIHPLSVLFPPRSWSFTTLSKELNLGNSQPKLWDSGSPDHMWP